MSAPGELEASELPSALPGLRHGAVGCAASCGNGPDAPAERGREAREVPGVMRGALEFSAEGDGGRAVWVLPASSPCPLSAWPRDHLPTLFSPLTVAPQTKAGPALLQVQSILYPQSMHMVSASCQHKGR